MKTKLITVATVIVLGYAGLQAQNPLWVSPSSNNNWVGINNTSTNNRLEITTSAPDPFFGSVNGSSGLRFTHLTSSKIPQTDPGNHGVLSVNAAGDVIYVIPPPPTISSIGGTCSIPDIMATARRVEMAGQIMNWTMPANNPSQFLIGLPACTTSIARLAVKNDHYNLAAVFQNIHNSATIQAGAEATCTNNSGKAIGLFANGISTSNRAIGVDATATATGNFSAIAVNGSSLGTGSAQNIGINGPTANGTTLSIAGNLDVQNSSSPINIGHQTDLYGGTNASAQSYGVEVYLGISGNQPGSANFGGFFGLGSGAIATNNYGVFASVPARLGGSGGTTTPMVESDYAGFFNGDVYISGLYGISDKRLKKDINKMENSIDIIKKLSPVTYSFDQENHKNITLSKGKQYGFVAQDIKEILPELTAPIVFPATIDNETGKEISPKEEYIGVNYQGFTAIMVDAIKQQQTTIENLQKQVDELKQLVAGNGNANNAADRTTSINTQSTELNDAVVLNQNQPNPFAEQTVISYNIPQGANNAQMLFYDAAGKQVNNISLTGKGMGQLNVYASDLSSGTYSYTLVVDGKVIDTKKMVKQ